MVSVSPDVKEPIAAEFSPAVIRGGEVIGSLTLGAIGGYFVYGLTCLVKRAGMIDKEVVLQPIPYVLSGIVSASIVETARLIYDAAFYTLGNREKYENLANPNEASIFDHLRQKTWKVISDTEHLQKNMDHLYCDTVDRFHYDLLFRPYCALLRISYKFKKNRELQKLKKNEEFKDLEESKKLEEIDKLLNLINLEEKKEFKNLEESQKVKTRTAEQIRAEFPTDQDYYKKSVFRVTEAARRAFFEQVDETMKGAIPQELSIYAVEALGYTIIGGHLFSQLLGLFFVFGVINKIGAIFERFEEEKNKASERKNTCELLAALCPYEMSKMEAAEAVLTTFEEVEDEFILSDVESVSDDDVSSDEDDEILTVGDLDRLARTAQVGFIHQKLDIYNLKKDNLTKFIKSPLPKRLRECKETFDYCRPTDPIKGFPVQKTQFDKEGKEIESDDVAHIEIKKENLPKNFVLVGL